MKYHMNNSYCQSQNDGFCCPLSHEPNYRPDWCLDCLQEVLKEIRNDIRRLKKEIKNI